MVSKRIREIRVAMGLSVRKLAIMSGISSTTISDIENAKTNPSVITLQKIATAIDVDPDIFFQSEPFVHKKNKLIISNDTRKFADELIQELIKNNIIKDPDNISPEMVDLIMSAVKKDLKQNSLITKESS